MSIVIFQIVKHYRDKELGIDAFNLQIATVAYGIDKLSGTMIVVHNFLIFIRKRLITFGT
jgi:hypothetical protein